jgi:CRISPR/Cas system CSM-associated protein Csm4 (group 5 of RAMP superfamily)
MTRIEYINENKTYINQKSLGLLENIDEEQFQSLVSATENMGNSDVGIVNEAVRTQETIEDFENSRNNYWRECSKVTRRGNAIFYEDVQMYKGQPRMAQLAVVDLGDFRVTLA